ncbi:hypothetical protein [Bacillus subtilis]|uniref:hypothetical protein n=1 Tax=Bacillus subtilis TaxID=1423 RepID=UPI000D029B00|nr:hypothetical protein [Bacillus subtilis]PRS91127.1 hypothetical protein C6349_16060 [Bacillus subtilis subsp. subtilis]PRS91512.1 hypothetical protein C6350_19260 [Bacillus subtilis subsp. subtilis]QHM12633.1 hypothetical protein C7M29_00241 [Bacillus subtilis]
MLSNYNKHYFLKSYTHEQRQFTAISSKQHVQIVNDLLPKEENDLQRVAKPLRVHQAVSKDCKFVKDDNLIIENPLSESDRDSLY